MKKIRITGLLLTGMFFLLSSCDKTNDTQSLCTASPSGDTVVFLPSQSLAMFANCSPQIQATVTEINDSRCPAGAVCVWAGKLSATLKLNEQFSIRLEQGVQKDTVFLGNAYSLKLIEALPKPDINTNWQGNQKLWVQVRKN